MAVRRTERLSARMVRVTLAGDLAGFTFDDPASSVRLLLPAGDELVIPAWNGNEFLLPGGDRPIIRTFTPLVAEDDGLDLMVVLHDGGAASAWAAAATPGDPAAISGPGRGYAVDRDAPSFLLAGDETAIPAIAQLLEALPADAQVAVHVEIARPDAELALPRHPRASVAWLVAAPESSPGDALVAAVDDADLDPAGRLWAAGEAAAMQRIRKLLAARGFPRSHATVRGYWKRRR